MQLEVFNTHVGQRSAYSLETRVGLLVYLRVDGFDPLVFVGIKTVSPGAANMSSPVEPVH